MLYWNMEPWGAHRDNIHAGILASIFANAFRGKGQKSLSYKDFLLIDPVTYKNNETKKFLGWMKAVAKKKHGVK